MPRSYKRLPGSRKYLDFTSEQLEECLGAIRSGEMSQRDAAEFYKISRSTIKRRLKMADNDVVNRPGHPTVFTQQEELAFATHLIKQCDFGFPLDELDFRFIVKCYLDKQGKRVNIFPCNMPGPDWAKSFLERRTELSVRFANNIKRARAAIDEQTITGYINNLSEVTKDVPPENIYNYDETCMSDDPGRSKIICRRGTKYPERVINSSKSNVSVMFCGNAAGSSIPPYVIYRADHLWTTWTENGPPGTRYNRTKHGWIDLVTFEEWFVTHLLPVMKKQEGKKVMIGDNLSSHLSLKVIKLCEENDIHFVCLPPNSSHLTQPLDVAYFRPMKGKWRQILIRWKQSEAGRNAGCLPKDQFPMLLKTLLHELEPKMESNIKAGFKKSGIFPSNKEEILSHLPHRDVTLNLSLVGDVFLTHLENRRQDFVKPKARKKKLNVPPGKSVRSSDLELITGENEPDASTSTKGVKIQKKVEPPQKKPRKKKTKEQDSSCSTSDDEVFSLQDSGESDLVLSEISEDEMVQSSPNTQSQSAQSSSRDLSTISPPEKIFEEDKGVSKDSVKEGTFVLVSWNNVLYPGMVTKINNDGAYVDCMEPTTKFWKWPSLKDNMHYKWCDIQRIIPPPKLLKRGLFSITQ